MKYIKLTREDSSQSCTFPLSELAGILETEFDGFEYQPVGATITLTIVEMSQDEYDKLPEFVGW